MYLLYEAYEIGLCWDYSFLVNFQISSFFVAFYVEQEN